MNKRSVSIMPKIGVGTLDQAKRCFKTYNLRLGPRVTPFLVYLCNRRARRLDGFVNAIFSTRRTPNGYYRLLAENFNSGSKRLNRLSSKSGVALFNGKRLYTLFKTFY